MSNTDWDRETQRILDREAMLAQYDRRSPTIGEALVELMRELREALNEA